MTRISPLKKHEELKINKNLNQTIKQLKKIKNKLNGLDLEKTSMLSAMNVGNHLDTQK
jgi:hypothetical protein